MIQKNTIIADPTNTTSPSSPQHGFLRDLLDCIKTSIIATIVLAVIVSGVYPLIVWGFAQALFHNKANGSLIDRDGNPTSDDSKAVGSSLLGQNFGAPQYFHPRPAANGYDATNSGGSNLGPTSAALFNGATQADPNDATKIIVKVDGIQLRVVHYCEDNNLPYGAFIKLTDEKGVTVLTPTKIKDDKGNLLDDVTLINLFNDTTKPVVIRSKEIPADAVTASASGLDPHISVANARLQIDRVVAARVGIKRERVEALIAQYTDSPDLGFLGEAGVNVLRLNLALDKEAPVPVAAPVSGAAPSTAPTIVPPTTSPATTAPATAPLR